MQLGANFHNHEAASCLEVALIGFPILIIQLLTFLSTSVQSLEPSIQASTKLGLTKLDFFLSFRYSLLTDSEILYSRKFLAF
jgi:hypothetical protein